MVVPRILVICALIAVVSTSLAARREILGPAEPNTGCKNDRNNRPEFAGAGSLAAAHEWTNSVLDHHVEPQRQHFSDPASISPRARRCRTDNHRKPVAKGTLLPEAKSLKRKVYKSRECGEQEGHQKMPHDVLNKCSQAKKEKTKAQDIKTKHGDLAQPPAKNGVPKGCEASANSTSSP